MAEPTRVEKGTEVRVLALFGDSVLIEGIEASLQDNEGVEIVRLDASQPGAVQALDRFSPDIIIFDLTPSQSSCVFTILQTHTDVILIGLDIDCDRALFLSAEWHRLPTVADLMQAIEARLQVRNGRRLEGRESLL